MWNEKYTPKSEPDLFHVGRKEHSVRVEHPHTRDNISTILYVVEDIYLRNISDASALYEEPVYKLRKEIKPPIPLRTSVPRTVIWTSKLLPKLRRTFLLNKFIESYKNEKERLTKEMNEYINTGQCVICKETQTHVSMSIDKHICLACKSYTNFIIHQYELGNIQSHPLIQEGRLLNDDGTWYIIIFPNEVKDL